MNRPSVFVVDIVKEIVDYTSTVLDMPINFVYGDAVDILRNLKDKDNSPEHKDSKYVLFALYMPFVERRGIQSLHYADVTIRRMTIATLTNSDDEPMVRYDKTFRPILYPVYEAFLMYFARSRFVASKDPNTVVHTKVDVMGAVPISGINDYVDCINLDNFQFTINQIFNC